MPRHVSVIERVRPLLPHLLAGPFALLYAWFVSSTQYVTTGVQFVSPLAVILVVHIAWLGKLEPGFARKALGRTLATAVGIIALTILATAYAPMPAEAAFDPGSIFIVLACLAVLALVIGAAAVAIYVAVLGAGRLFNLLNRWSGRTPGQGESRLYDLGYVAIAFLAIGVASLEGLAGAFTFSAQDRASSTVAVAAPPARVWQEVGKATSPHFPLPVMLKSIPQPVAVVVDEGAMPGARRVVRFKGREGEGDLVLQVARRTDKEVVFQAVSDTSPIAMWVRQSALTFRVEPAGTGSRLTVSSDYERLLSPAWFFRPYIRLASYLAVDVLARDTRERAEAR